MTDRLSVMLDGLTELLSALGNLMNLVSFAYYNSRLNFSS